MLGKLNSNAKSIPKQRLGQFENYGHRDGYGRFDGYGYCDEYEHERTDLLRRRGIGRFTATVYKGAWPMPAATRASRGR
jgi:hypothetical protein